MQTSKSREPAGSVFREYDVIISDNTRKSVEKKPEPLGTALVAGVISVHGLIDITLQIDLAYYMICPENHTFEIAPETFYRIGCHPIT